MTEYKKEIKDISKHNWQFICPHTNGSRTVEATNYGERQVWNKRDTNKLG